MARRPINLALQGGGAHGAFTWGVLDRLLEEDVTITAISGTSAGAMNAVVVSEGLLEGGPDKAREQLEGFWLGMARTAELISPFRRGWWNRLGGSYDLQLSWMYESTLAFTRVVSPYQFNPMNYNPLRQALNELIDFEKVRRNSKIKLFINTTHVPTGGLRVFREHELTVDMVLASACLPWLFQTPVVDGEGYWDGGYIANPAIEPMLRATGTRDAMIVQLNPIIRAELPTRAHEIFDRLNEITFNASLLSELRFIAERNRLIDEGELSPERHPRVILHMVHGSRELSAIPSSTKLLAERDFILKLRDMGRESMSNWLDRNADSIGRRSTFDYRKLVHELTQAADAPPSVHALGESGPS
jgi:NTE family protein